MQYCRKQNVNKYIDLYMLLQMAHPEAEDCQEDYARGGINFKSGYRLVM